MSNKLTPMIIEVTPVNERIMRLRIRHSLGVISLVSLYFPTEASDLTLKDTFYATLESVVDQCPKQDTLLVLGDFNASTGTDRDGVAHAHTALTSNPRKGNTSQYLPLELQIQPVWMFRYTGGPTQRSCYRHRFR